MQYDIFCHEGLQVLSEIIILDYIECFINKNLVRYFNAVPILLDW